MKASEFAEGARCDLHDLAYCVDCRERLGIRRGLAKSGESEAGFYFTNDCGIQTLAETIGASYDEAAELLGSGFNPRTGTDAAALTAAIESAGYKVRKAGAGTVSAKGTRTSGLTIPEAVAASLSGRVYILIGSDRRDAHAWSIVNGRVNRAFLRAPYKYGILEVTA